MNGQTLTFAASGWTWHDIFVLWDFETGSLWFPGISFPGGTDYLLCISGPLQDERIFAMPSFRGFWKSWYGVNPTSKVARMK